MRRALRGERLPPPTPKTTALLRTPPTALQGSITSRGARPPLQQQAEMKRDERMEQKHGYGIWGAVKETEEERRNTERERDAFCLEQPWYLENQPLQSSAATSLFRAGSERAGGLLNSTGLFFPLLTCCWWG